MARTSAAGVRSVKLRVALEIREEDAQRLAAAERPVLVEVGEDLRARSLALPLAPDAPGDDRVGGEHEEVPLPPGRVPVAGDGHREHRLGEQDPAGRDGERDRRPPLREQPSVAVRGVPVEDGADDPERDERIARRLGGDGVVEGRQRAQRDDRPGDERGADAAQEERAVADDRLGLSGAERKRRGRGEDRAQEEPERRGDLEAGVLARDEDARRGEGVEPEEPGADQERERDEQDARVAPPRRGLAHEEAEREARDRRGEDEPEVRGLMLPVEVEARDPEEEEEARDGKREDGGPDGRATHSAALSSRSYGGPRKSWSWCGSSRRSRTSPSLAT